jgi:membrane protease YdiL (CAAX protease family)
MCRVHGFTLLGLDRCPPFYRDALYWLAWLAAGVFWLGLWLTSAVQPLPWQQVWSWPFFSLALWQPFMEELGFRGVLQGSLTTCSWGRKGWHGITLANGITSVLFAFAHCWHHPPFWAAAVLAPSLVFGVCRERYRSVYPAMLLHAFYNAGYFMLTGLP